MTTQPSEQEAAATLASECADHASVILWCADRVRSVDDDPAVRDAADYLHYLATRAQVDATPVTDRPAVIRWCAMEIHSMGGDYAVERAAEYLDDLATEAVDAQSPHWGTPDRAVRAAPADCPPRLADFRHGTHTHRRGA